MAVELEDDSTLNTAIESAFVDLGERLRRELDGNGGHRGATPAGGPTGSTPSTLDTAVFLPIITAMVEFTKLVPGFRRLCHDDRSQLLKVSFLLFDVCYIAVFLVGCLLPSASPSCHFNARLQRRAARRGLVA